MVLNWIFMVLVGIVAYLWCPSNEHDILVLVNSSTFSISSLKEIKNLKAAFKISRNIYDEIKEVPDSFKTKVNYHLHLFLTLPFKSCLNIKCNLVNIFFRFRQIGTWF